MAILVMIGSRTGIINKVQNKLAGQTQKGLYYTFIYLYLTYCKIVWRRAPKVYLSPIHVLLKISVCIFSQVRYRNHTQLSFKQHQILNI